MAQNLTLGGDVMLGRSFNAIWSHNPRFNVWGDLPSHLRGRQAVIFNLETTLTNHSQKWPGKRFNYRLSPRWAGALEEAYVSHVSLANNHSLDFGRQGLIDTLQCLDNMNISHAGAGLTLAQAQQAVISPNGIGYLSASDHPPYWAAGVTLSLKGAEGINYINVKAGDWGTLLQQVRQLRAQPRLRTLICSLHWGSNWADLDAQSRPQPTAAMQRLAYDLTREGVDIIHGHSAHHLLPLVMMNSGLVTYSLGDLIDDYLDRPQYRSYLACLVDVTTTGEGRVGQVVVRPTRISRWVGHSWPLGDLADPSSTENLSISTENLSISTENLSISTENLSISSSAVRQEPVRPLLLSTTKASQIYHQVNFARREEEIADVNRFLGL